MAGLLGGGSYIVVVVGLCCCCRFVCRVTVARPLSSGRVASDGGVRTTDDEICRRRAAAMLCVTGELVEALSQPPRG